MTKTSAERILQSVKPRVYSSQLRKFKTGAYSPRSLKYTPKRNFPKFFFSRQYQPLQTLPLYKYCFNMLLLCSLQQKRKWRMSKQNQ